MMDCRGKILEKSCFLAQKNWSIFEKKNQKIVMAHFPLPFASTT